MTQDKLLDEIVKNILQSSSLVKTLNTKVASLHVTLLGYLENFKPRVRVKKFSVKKEVEIRR